MAYSAHIWSTLKIAYESGKYASVDEVLQELSKKYPKLPAHSMVQKRIDREDWTKAALAPLIEKSIQTKFIDAFAKRGFDESKVAKIVNEMAAADKPVIVPSNQIDKEGNKEPGFSDVIPDWQARDKALTQYAKFTGSYAAEKQEINGKLLIPPNVLQVEIIK
jgi:ribosome-binding ATPase YchF (GTP1/OBG family)